MFPLQTHATCLHIQGGSTINQPCVLFHSAVVCPLCQLCVCCVSISVFILQTQFSCLQSSSECPCPCSCLFCRHSFPHSALWPRPTRVEDLTPDLLTLLPNSGIKVILMTCLPSAVRHVKDKVCTGNSVLQCH